MKLSKLTLLSLTILTTLLIGAGTISVFTSGATEIGAGVAWDPKSYTWLDLSPPEPWNAEIWLKGGHKAQTEINYTTIRLEGEYTPIFDQIHNATHGPRLIAPFHGTDVTNALWSKVPSHMGILLPGTYRVSLEITGYLKQEYGGTLFRGDGVIVVTVPAL